MTYTTDDAHERMGASPWPSLTYSIEEPTRGGRSPVMARNVVTTSHPLAVEAGMHAFRRGGNAIDAALAAAITLTVVEPTGCGLGSDAFAIVWDGERAHGLNGSGRSPAAWTRDRFSYLGAVPEIGWESVTVPGAISAWVVLSRRFGRLPFDQLFEDAVRHANDGFLIPPMMQAVWAAFAPRLQQEPGFVEAFMPNGRIPSVGDRFTFPDLARSLELIAASEGAAFYEGPLADAMVAHARSQGAALSHADLAQHQADWVEPLRMRFMGCDVLELPPNGHGLTVLSGLGMLEHLDVGSFPPDGVDAVHLQIEATKRAFADAHAYLADEEAMAVAPTALLDPAYLRSRANEIDLRHASLPSHGVVPGSSTVYLSAADEEGRMVSFIQSNYMAFGSGVVVPGTGISLQNRAAGFTLDASHPNCVAGGKRPVHTIIPGFVTRNGAPLLSFGVMGGPMQPQGHVQLLVRMLAHRQDPQAAVSAPRWRWTEGREVAVESSVPSALVDALRARGHEVVIGDAGLSKAFAFGGAQVVWRDASGHYVAGSDPRKDGFAAGW